MCSQPDAAGDKSSSGSSLYGLASSGAEATYSTLQVPGWVLEKRCLISPWHTVNDKYLEKRMNFLSFQKPSLLCLSMASLCSLFSP